MADTSAPLEPGTILAGKFRIERVLGQGAMGVVVQAHHLKLDEEVAIKFLLPEALANPEAVRRFEREARAAAKIKSEHIVRVSDVGTLDSGAPYMVMEYLNGTDLGAVVEKQGPLPLEVTVDYLLQACEAIAEAHSLGIVHRDLKPANLFLSHRPDGSPCVKVLDFGISKVTNRRSTADDAGMTSTTAVMGSPLYMSPEQLTSAREVDARTDIWALGVILYELLTDRCPFTAETMPQLCMKVLTQPPEPIQTHRKDLPPQVEALILDCLRKEREERIPNVAEFARRLSECAPEQSQVSVGRITRLTRGSAPGTEPLPAPVAPKPPAVAAQTFTEFGKTNHKEGPGSRRVVWLSAGAGALVLSIILAVALGRGSSDEAPTSAASSPPSSPPASSPVTEAPAAVAPAQPEAPVVTPAPAPSVTPPAAESAEAAAQPAPAAPPAPATQSAQKTAQKAAGTTTKKKPSPQPSGTATSRRLQLGGRL